MPNWTCVTHSNSPPSTTRRRRRHRRPPEPFRRKEHEPVAETGPPGGSNDTQLRCGRHDREDHDLDPRGCTGAGTPRCRKTLGRLPVESGAGRERLGVKLDLSLGGDRRRAQAPPHLRYCRGRGGAPPPVGPLRRVLWEETLFALTSSRRRLASQRSDARQHHLQWAGPAEVVALAEGGSE